MPGKLCHPYLTPPVPFTYLTLEHPSVLAPTFPWGSFLWPCVTTFNRNLYFSWMALITRFCDYFIKVHLPRLTISSMRAAGAQHMAHPFVSGWMKEWIAFLQHRGPHLTHLCRKWMREKPLSAYDSLRNPIGMLIETDSGDRKEILGLFRPITLSKWPVFYCPKCLFNAAF